MSVVEVTTAPPERAVQLGAPKADALDHERRLTLLERAKGPGRALAFAAVVGAFADFFRELGAAARFLDFVRHLFGG